LIRKYSKSDDDEKSKLVTMIFKQNVLVLATGKNYIGSDDPSKNGKSYGNITLLVSLLAAQELTHVQKMGTLSYLVRNDADVEMSVITPTTDKSVFRSAVSGAVPQQDDKGK